MRFVVPGVQWGRDLWWNLSGLAGIPERLAGGDDVCQVFQTAYNVGSSIKRFETADRDEPQRPAAPDGDTQAITFDKPPPFAGNRRGGRGHVERFVHIESKLLELSRFLRQGLKDSQPALVMKIGRQFA